MNNDLDNWLSSIGYEEPPVREETPSSLPEPEPVESVESAVVLQQPPVAEPQPISTYEFESLLQNLGDNEPPEDAQAEEISDESVNDTEEADLDAEEDAEWDNRLNSGSIHVVPNPENTQSDIISTLIPENSPTLLANDTTSRFSGAEWFEEIQTKRITFAGLGGIGSWACLLLGRMAIRTLYLYDDDVVEYANMSGQLYSRKDVTKYKSEAIEELLGLYTSTTSIYSFTRRFEEGETGTDIMICGFDNMAARKTFFNAWKTHVEALPDDAKPQCLFIDGRLSMDQLQVFCIQGTDTNAQERYENKYLFSDEEAEETVCSMKQTSYLAAMIGSIITNLFTNWAANLLNPVIPYDLPFFTEYNAQYMIFKTEH